MNKATEKLFEAVENDDVGAAKVAIEHGAVLNSIGVPGSNPLLCAAHCGSYNCLVFLIKSGSDIDFINSFGNTAAIIAACGGQDKCLSLLVEYGADLSLKDLHGRTALFWAEEIGNKKCEKLIRDKIAEDEMEKKRKEKWRGFSRFSGETSIGCANCGSASCREVVRCINKKKHVMAIADLVFTIEERNELNEPGIDSSKAKLMGPSLIDDCMRMYKFAKKIMSEDV